MREPDWQSGDVKLRRRTLIYALLCPRTRAVRYVGKTSGSLPRRVIQHMNAARNGKNTYLCRWLRVIAAKPLAAVIQVVEPGGDWAAAERRWIRRCREHGCRLTNITDGGEGLCGLSFSAAHRAKIAAAHRTGKMVACTRCGSSMWRKANELRRRPRHFCSRECYQKWQVGKTKQVPEWVNTAGRRAALAIRRARTKCRNGHLLIGDNLYVNTQGARVCKRCRAEYKQQWRRRKAVA